MGWLGEGGAGGGAGGVREEWGFWETRAILELVQAPVQFANVL